MGDDIDERDKCFDIDLRLRAASDIRPRRDQGHVVPYIGRVAHKQTEAADIATENHASLREVTLDLILLLGRRCETFQCGAGAFDLAEYANKERALT